MPLLVVMFALYLENTYEVAIYLALFQWNSKGYKSINRNLDFDFMLNWNFQSLKMSM